MARIHGLTFGSVVVGGKKYPWDILTFADDMVRKRKGGLLMFGSHEIKRQDLEELSQGQPALVIVGTGTDGAAHMAPEAESWAKADNLDLLVQPSYDAVAKTNEFTEQKEKVAVLIHISR